MTTKKVRFLKDEFDLEIDVVICIDGQEEYVLITNSGIAFERWCEQREEYIWYYLPESEEDIMYTFID